MFVEGKSRTVFFPSDTLIYGISRNGSKNYNIRTCEHMILGQLRMGARQTNYAPLVGNLIFCSFISKRFHLGSGAAKAAATKERRRTGFISIFAFAGILLSWLKEDILTLNTCLDNIFLQGVVSVPHPP